MHVFYVVSLESNKPEEKLKKKKKKKKKKKLFRAWRPNYIRVFRRDVIYIILIYVLNILLVNDHRGKRTISLPANFKSITKRILYEWSFHMK